MSEQQEWQASLREHRTAWIVASLCLLLIVVASIKPDLFELPEQVAEPEQSQEAVTRHEQSLAERIAPPIEEKSEPVANKVEPQPVIEPEQPLAVIDAAKPTPAKKAPETKPVSTPVAKTAPSTLSSGYYVQLGAFGEKTRAQGLVDQLKRQGFSAVIAPKPGGLHAVWAGPKRNRDSATRLQTAIEKRLKSKGFIVHHKGA